MSSLDLGEAAPDAASDRPSFRTLSGRQRALLLATLLAITFSLLAIAEIGLRIVDYGTDYPLFVPVEPDPTYLMPNPGVGGRYFRHAAGTPVPMADLFRAQKRPENYRIFVQGGSTVAGFPYGHGGAFTRMLEQRLQETFPELEIEVVNVALDATNSHTVLDQAREIIEQAPDAVLIYAGHNEYYGVLGVASAESMGRSPSLVRSYIALRKLRTMQAIQDAVDWTARGLRELLDRPTPPRRTLMEYLASEHTVVYRSPRWEAGPRQLRRNMDDLLALYQAAGVPVFFGTVASNDRDQPPFIGDPASPADSATRERLEVDARTALARGDTAAAATAIRELLQQDSTAAGPWYLLGRLRDAAGDVEGARGAYRAARDRDRLPFRAPTPINRTLRALAADHGATLVETERALAAASGSGIVDATVMLEHLHPTLDGQFILADAFYRALQEAGTIGDWGAGVSAEEARGRIPVTAVDSLYGRLTIDALTAGFPFRPAGGRAISLADTLRPRDELEGIALAYYRGQLSWLQAMGELEDHYGSSGQWERVAHVNRVLAQEAAYTPEPLLSAAQAALLAGDDARAMEDLRAAERRWPTARGAWLSGNLYARGGDTAAARKGYERALELDRGYQRARAALSALSSLPELDRAVAASRWEPEQVAELAAAYFMTGRYEEADTLTRRILRDDPGNARGEELSRRLRAIYRRDRE